VIEARSSHPLLPFRVLRNRDRSGAYLISLCTGTALIGMFFFLTLFVQGVWGYSPLKTAAAYLPFVPAVLATTALTQQGVNRIGPRPLLIAGSAVAAGGMFWASRLTEHSTFAGGLLGPELLVGAGLGPLFVLIFLVGLIKVNNNDTGVASGLVNVGEQVGGAIGLAIVGTVAWSAVASTRRSATAAAAAAQAGAHPSAAQTAALKAHALATGFSQGYLVSAGVLVLSLVIALFMMRVSRADLAGAEPAPEPAGDASSPGPA
jgi:predicted MFS family arabinose efflux permease